MESSCTCCGDALAADRLESMPQAAITGDLCESCRRSLIGSAGDGQKKVLNAVKVPVLLMQPEPRRVRTANNSACELFGKDLSQIEGFRGGEVFNCEHAFSELGCGLDDHCRECTIRNTIVGTFTTGISFGKVTASLPIRVDGTIRPHRMTITTEKAGELALVKIDQFDRTG